MDKNELVKAISEAKSKAKKRKFPQSVDVALNVSPLDFDKPENKIDEKVFLPKGRGKGKRVVLIAQDSELTFGAKDIVDKILSKNDIESLGASKKEAKRVASEYDVFLAEPALMSSVGRFMGRYLAPRNKMPSIAPSASAVKAAVEKIRDTVIVKNNRKNIPTLHFAVGIETMGDEDLAENAMSVINVIERKLEEKGSKLRSVFVKLSMGPAVRVGD